MSRGAAILQALLVRPLLFVFWALVLWGTLLLPAIVWNALTRGLHATLATLEPPRTTDVWAWANLALPGLALVMWLLAGAAWAARSRR